MIKIDVSSQTESFNYNKYFKEYFTDSGPGNPDPFESKFIRMTYDLEKVIDLYGKKFFYDFQNHIVSGTLKEMVFTLGGESILEISGLNISNKAGEAGEFHQLIAALMGGGAPGTGSDAAYKVLLGDLGADAQHYIGGSGADTYTGTKFGDRIEGRLGDDKLKGGDGKDTFVFNTELGPDNVDKIGDYNVKQDTIELSRKIFSDIGKGTLDEDQFSKNKISGDDAQILYKNGKLFYVDDDGDTTQFATVGDGLKLSHDDFLVA